MSNTRHSRRRLLALALGGIAAPRVIAGGGKAMAQTTQQVTPQTVVYVSNAGDPSISILAMDRKTGDLSQIDAMAIPGADKPSPTSMPLAVSPDGRFLYAALRSEPFMGASFAIDRQSGRLKHLGNAPLDASMAYTTVDKSGKWLLCASYPQGKLTINPTRATRPPRPRPLPAPTADRGSLVARCSSRSDSARCLLAWRRPG